MNLGGRHFSWPSMLVCGLAFVGVVLAVSFGFGVAPWLILMGAFCVLMMGSMMLMMIGGMGMHGMHSAGRSAHDESRADNEGALEILERRFAEGAISAEDYQARHKILVGPTNQSNGGGKDEPLTVPVATEGRRR
jgi:uncharacterized membrane protein